MSQDPRHNAGVPPVCFCGRTGVLRESRYGWFWSCPDRQCDGLVGCHPGTKVPLGTMAGKATRQARKAAHDAFDALWQPMGRQRKIYRSAAYAWLAEAMGVPDIHIGTMTRAQAEQVVELCEGMGPEDVEEWVVMNEVTDA